MNINERLKLIHETIQSSLGESSEHRDIRLVAVTKTHEADIINQAIDAGVTDVAENRVQEILRKYPDVQKNVHWHLIGSLQTNKVKYIIDKVELIQSLDRVELAREIQKRAAAIGKTQDCLIQLKVSEEESKQGMDPDDLISFLELCNEQFPNIRICGIMGMAPYFSENEKARKYFQELRAHFERAANSGFVAEAFTVLSMGMSNDYPIAVSEGATMLRIGSALFNP